MDAMGKLDKFSAVFDIEKYRKNEKDFKNRLVLANGREVFATDNYEYCKRKGMELPSWLEARTATIPKAISNRLKKK